MNEIFKKIEELSHYVQQHAEEHDHMPTVIIASPDMSDEEGTTLCAQTGRGVDIVEMLATAFSENDSLMRFAKDAIAVVEGGRIMSRIARVRKQQRMEKEGPRGCDADNSHDDNEQPTCTAACDSGEEMGACDGDNCEHCRCDEERGPEPTCGMPEFAAE